jgi:TRAP-type C4-dicarboxylate transport system substrate-binding protein
MARSSATDTVEATRSGGMMRHSSLARMAVVAAATMCTVAVTGSCAGSTAKTPSPAVSTLTFAFTGSFADPQIENFETELSRRSSGAVRIRIEPEFGTDTHKVEQRIIAAVASGGLDVGWVGVRAFAELGVHDFDALIAPMLLDSLDAQRAVLASDVPTRMLAGIADFGVAGLALMGGPLRRPIAADSPLTTVASFAGIPFYSWHGDLNTQSVVALGATNVDLAPPDRNAGIANGTIRAYENSLAYLATALERRARIMTGNLNLWPSMGVLIANPATLAALPGAHREALLGAAAAASVHSLDVLEDESALALTVCDGGGSLAEVAASELEAFRARFAPVYERLQADPVTAGYLKEVKALKAGMPADRLKIPSGCEAR